MYQARASAASRADLVELAGLAAEQAGRPIVVAEVGSFRGESARIMLDTGAVSRIYCIDPWVGGYDPGDLASGSDMAAVEGDFDRRVGGDPRVVKCKGDIVDFVSKYRDVAIDLVYIDGKHTYDAVVRDIGVALGRIKPVVAVSGHDYHRRNHPGVCRAVDELLGGPQHVFSDKSWIVFRDGSGVAVADSGKGKAMSNVDYSKIWDRFDMVIVLAFTGYQDRIPPLMAELRRVGLADRAELFWSFPSPFDTRFANSIRLSGTIHSLPQFNEAMAHYRALKTALELGKSSVLVLEDDVRFLRDVAGIEAALQQLPGDCDVAKLEWFRRTDLPEIVPSGGMWTPIKRGLGAAGGAATAYTHRALEWKTTMIERPARYDDFHGELWIPDQYDTGHHFANAGLHAYVSTPMLAIQEPKYTRTSCYQDNKHNGLLSGGSVDSYEVDA